MAQVVHLARTGGLPPGRDVLLPGRGRTFVRHLRRPGERMTVVLLHGWAATADLNWSAAYAALGEQFDVVTIDHRGHGRGLRSRTRFTLEDCADDVAAVLTELGVGASIIAGYSMGGPIAQLVWRRHPELVAGLVLCATSNVFRDSTRDRALFAAATGAASVSRTRPSKLAVQLIGDTVSRRRRLAASPGGQILTHDWAQVLEAGRAIGRFDSRSWLPRVDVPVAMVTTLHDSVVPTRRQRAMAATLPLVANAMVDGGHCACLQSDSGFVDAFLDMCHAVAGAEVGGELRRAG
jgi:3-oxoadipate enol-lactonase